jgi:NADPH:quinone reductase-like Zn-dependent oxidoreductase
MRAVVRDRYGGPDVLRIAEVERPAPKDDEVLVRVHATTVNRTDCGFRAGHPFIVRLFIGLLRPKRHILGMEFAGAVAAVGAAVTEFEVGDHVFGVKTGGAHAEFLRVRESAPLAHKPACMSFEEAASACDGAGLALACLRKADVRKGQRILVYGASGAVGTAAVQLAKHFGADVTAVCRTRNLELVRSLGADRVLDYTKDDFVSEGATYDAILDAYGKLPVLHSRRALKPGGVFVATDADPLWLAPIVLLLTRWMGDKKMKFGVTHHTKQDVLFLKQLIETGSYRPVVDRCYPLEQVVEATRYVESGWKTGNVVLSIGS